MFAALLFSACSDDGGSTRVGVGTVSPIVTVDPDVEADQTADIVISPIPSAEQLSLRISTTDGSYSHTWQLLSEFNPDEPLLPGSYIAEAFYGTLNDEGFDCPAFSGSAPFEVVDGEVARPEIVCSLVNTMLLVKFSDAFTDYFTDASVTLHSSGGGFVEYTPAESRQAYLRAGEITVSVALTLPDGRAVDFMAAKIPDAESGRCYTTTLSADLTGDVPAVIISFDERITTDDVRIALTPEFIFAEAPTITCTGFISDSPIHVDEGLTPDTPLTATATGIEGGQLLLTVTSPTLLEAGWQHETDLLSVDAALLDLMERYGLKITRDEHTATVDFTDVVPRLRADVDANATFSLRAVSSRMKVSEPAILAVALGEVDIELIGVAPVTVGIDEASLIVHMLTPDATANIGVEILSASGSWQKADIIEIQPLETAGNYAVRFAIPAGTMPVDVRLLYCGDIRLTTNLVRRPPNFTIEVDAFAQCAVVRFVADDESLLPTIVRLASIYADSERMLQLDRDEENATVTVTGLNPQTRYALRATVMEQPTGESDFTAPVAITTEAATQLPNNDFEENAKAIDYQRMPSGGRFSQTIVPIFNNQNFTSFATQQPTGWANVNAKTFCRAAKNHNTWYMAPSAQTVTDVYSTAYAVRLDNVGWDLDGPEIPDYVQTGQPYTSYSRNIPAIARKSVGKLFLGKYNFDPATLTESYDEGVDFASRPSSLNGFYKFLPPAANADARGLARIELIGYTAEGDVTIASGSTLLTTATGYTAFSIPLTYTRFGVKATRIKVMLAASDRIGDIDFETANTTTVDDPASATSRGASLWVDALTLSY